MDGNVTDIGEIGNYYGGLGVTVIDGLFYWGIMDWDNEYHWEEIPKSLYNELIKFQSSK